MKRCKIIRRISIGVIGLWILLYLLWAIKYIILMLPVFKGDYNFSKYERAINLFSKITDNTFFLLIIITVTLIIISRIYCRGFSFISRNVFGRMPRFSNALVLFMLFILGVSIFMVLLMSFNGVFAGPYNWVYYSITFTLISFISLLYIRVYYTSFFNKKLWNIGFIFWILWILKTIWYYLGTDLVLKETNLTLISSILDETFVIVPFAISLNFISLDIKESVLSKRNMKITWIIFITTCIYYLLNLYTGVLYY